MGCMDIVVTEWPRGQGSGLGPKDWLRPVLPTGCSLAKATGHLCLSLTHDPSLSLTPSSPGVVSQPHSGCRTHPHRPGSSDTGICFSWSWRLEAQDQGVGGAGFFGGLSRWLVDGRLLPSSRGLAPERVSKSRHLVRTLAYGIRVPLMASLYLNYLFKIPMSKYGHVLKSQSLGFKHNRKMNLGRMQYEFGGGGTRSHTNNGAFTL